MPRLLTACVVAALLLVAACPAAGACDPAAAARTPALVAARIDQYRFAPRAPGTFRALAGRGDPAEIPTEEYSYASSQIPPAQRRLIARMLPGQESPDPDYWYPSPGDCRIDHAVSVALARVARFGENHPYVAQWLRVQRAVFTACRSRDPQDWMSTAAQRSGRRPRIALPPAMPSEDPGIARLQRDDRAYQQAALLFYQYDPGAERAFRAISASASPHAHIARYMLAALHARDLDRYAIDDGGGRRPAQQVAQANAALAEARAILADPGLADIHPLAQGLLGYLGYNIGDVRIREAQIGALLDALDQPIDRIAADPAAADRYARAIADVGYLRWEDGGWDSPTDEHPISRAMIAQGRQRPLAAWLLVPRSPFDTGPWSRARAWTYSEASNLPLLERGPGRAHAVIDASFKIYDQAGSWEAIDALILESRACPSDDRLAAVAPLFYHRVRTALMYPIMDENYRPAARQDGFADALARLETWPWRDSRHYRELVSDMLQYLIATGRNDEARRLRDRLQPRGEGYEAARVALLLLAEDEDRLAAEIAAAPDAGQALLNQLSVEALARLTGRDDLPAEIRARFARVAWTRSYALQRRVPIGLDRLMRRLNPQIASAWTSRPGARADDRRLLLDVLRSPGLNILIGDGQRRDVPDPGDALGDAGLTRIDVWLHSDNNWWCAWQPVRHRVGTSAVLYDAFFASESEGYRDRDPLAVAGAQAALVPLLGGSWLWRSRDEGEQAALARIPCAPQLLAERAVAWRGGGLLGGRVAGQDEALALAVRATRYGCQRQGGHGAWSRAAFAALHRLFHGSEAARRTRFWFDCAHFSGGCAGGAYADGEPTWDRWTMPGNY